MKKMFSIFLLFATFSMVSCGGLLGDDGSKSTVRFTLPADGRSASAGGAGDVDYYNVYIARQSFTNVRGGSTVESSPLPVGTEVSVSAEAIGNIKDGSGNTVASGRRVAYYQTTQRLPASGLTLNVNMANYKTEYHKVTLDMDGFDNRITSPTYVASGESYTLSDFGIVVPTGGTSNKPNKHTGWLIRIPGVDDPPSYSIGESVPITSDTTFTVQYESGIPVTFSAIDEPAYYLIGLQLDDTIYYSNNGQQYIFLNIPFTLPTAKKQDQGLGTEIEVDQWQWYEDGVQRTGVPGEKITITSTSGSSYNIQAP